MTIMKKRNKTKEQKSNKNPNATDETKTDTTANNLQLNSINTISFGLNYNKYLKRLNNNSNGTVQLGESAVLADGRRVYSKHENLVKKREKNKNIFRKIINFQLSTLVKAKSVGGNINTT